MWMNYLKPFVNEFISAVGVVNPDAKYKVSLRVMRMKFVNYISTLDLRGE